MGKTILIPIDFSNNSKQAVEFAVNLALKQHFAIHLYHNYTSQSISYPSEQEELNDPIFKADKLMLNWVKEIQDLHPELNVSFQTERGLISENLPHLTKTKEFCLIVMGTKGMTNDDSKFLGSTTYMVSKKAEIPVLCIPENTASPDFTSVGMLSNFKNEEFATVRSYVDLFGNHFNLKIIHVHFEEATKKTVEQEMENWKMHIHHQNKIDNIQVEVALIQENNADLDTIPEVINTIVVEDNIQLLLVTKTKKSFIERLFNPSVSKEIINHPVVPIFFYNNADN